MSLLNNIRLIRRTNKLINIVSFYKRSFTNSNHNLLHNEIKLNNINMLRDLINTDANTLYHIHNGFKIIYVKVTHDNVEKYAKLSFIQDPSIIKFDSINELRSCLLETNLLYDLENEHKTVYVKTSEQDITYMKFTFVNKQLGTILDNTHSIDHDISDEHLNYNADHPKYRNIVIQSEFH